MGIQDMIRNRNKIRKARALPHTQQIRVAAAFVLAFAAVMLPVPAHAGTPMGEVLCFVLYIILGNAGRGLATIGVSVIGVAEIGRAHV